MEIGALGAMGATRGTGVIAAIGTLDPFGLKGQILDGQYRVDEVVGEGGFGVVYRGHHLGLREPIAVKCLRLPPQLGSPAVEASFVQRFRDESRLYYRLSQGSLHIVRSIAAGTTVSPTMGTTVPYMVLEWLEGRSLAEDLAIRRARGDAGRPLAEVIALLDGAAEGLAFAHEGGVVHRDVNPGNLFLLSSPGLGPRVKVLDFGVAKIMSDHALSLGPRAQTLGSIRMFSPAYAAPEQFDEAFGDVCAASDVYSFALVLVEALRDRPAMDGETIVELAMAARDRARRPTPRHFGLDLGDEVEAVFARALQGDPRQRFATIGPFWRALCVAARTPTAFGSVSTRTAKMQPMSEADAQRRLHPDSSPPAIPASPATPAMTTLAMAGAPPRLPTPLPGPPPAPPENVPPTYEEPLELPRNSGPLVVVGLVVAGLVVVGVVLLLRALRVL